MWSASAGSPIPNPQFMEQESWSTTHKEPVKYIPLQAKKEIMLYYARFAIEVEFENEKYLIVPHSAIMMLLRPGT